MLYYFSGTGNSKLVCQTLAVHLKDCCSTMTHPLPCNDKDIGIVFPVYAWGMPKVVKHFVDTVLPKLISGKTRYIYAVMTCGDDIGYTDTLVRKSLERNGMQLSAAFSIQMPNTYVCLPGFDVDHDEVVHHKVAHMQRQLPDIVRCILARGHVTAVCRGAWPHVKTSLLRPLFNAFLISDKHFHVDDERCIHCGLCARRCPMGNIDASQSAIRWKGDCTTCLACYHACPTNAIQYGMFTKGKGQKKEP